MAYRSNLPNTIARVNRARDAALIAAAEVVRTAVKDEHRGGYTSGLLVTGNEISKIVLGELRNYPGGREISVTTAQVDPPYPFWWATGFVPARGVFSPGLGPNTQGPVAMMKVDHWTPAAAKSASGARAEYDRVYAMELA